MACTLPLDIYVGTIADPVQFTAVDTITYTLQGGNHTFSFTTQHPIAAWRFLDRAKVEVYRSGNLIYNGILQSVTYNFRKDQPQCRYQVNGYAEHLRRYPVTFRTTGKVLGLLETILTEGKATDFISLVDTQYISEEKKNYDMTIDFVQQYADQAIADVCSLLGVSYYIHPTSNVLVLYEPAYMVTLDHVINLDDTSCAELKIFNPELQRENNRYSKVIVCSEQEVLNLLKKGVESQEALQTMMCIPVPVEEADDRSFPFRKEGEEEKRTITAAFIRANGTGCKWLNVAGTGTFGYTGDGGLAVNAQISSSCLVHANNALYMFQAGNNGNVLRKINLTTGIISTITADTGNGYAGVPGLASGAEIGFTYSAAPTLCHITGNDLAIFSTDITPTDLGNRILRLTDGGTVDFIAGTAGYSDHWDGTTGSALSVQLGSPTDITSDGTNLYFWQVTNDTAGYRLLKLDNSGNISVIAGGGTSIPADGMAATSAYFASLRLSDLSYIMPGQYGISKGATVTYGNNSIYFPLVYRHPGVFLQGVSIWRLDLTSNTLHIVAWHATISGRWPCGHNVDYVTHPQVSWYYAGLVFGRSVILRFANNKLIASGDSFTFAINIGAGWSAYFPESVNPATLILDLTTGKQYFISGLPQTHNYPIYKDVTLTSNQNAAFPYAFAEYESIITSNRAYIQQRDRVTTLTCLTDQHPEYTVKPFLSSAGVGVSDLDGYGFATITPGTYLFVQETLPVPANVTGYFYCVYSLHAIVDAPNNATMALAIKINGDTVHTASATNGLISLKEIKLDISLYAGTNVTVQLFLTFSGVAIAAIGRIFDAFWFIDSSS